MKPRPIRNCALVVANPKALLLYLATTHFANVIFIVTCKLALISLFLSAFNMCFFWISVNEVNLNLNLNSFATLSREILFNTRTEISYLLEAM